MKTLLLLAVFLFTATTAHADLITYAYTGLPFRVGQGVIQEGDFISAEATIDFTGIAGVYEATSWLISAGPVTVSNSDAAKLTSISNQFTLDVQGNILFWSLSAGGEYYGVQSSLVDLISTNKRSPSTIVPIDFVGLDHNQSAPCGPGIDPPTCSFGQNIGGPGVWTRQSVPEPSSLALLVAGLAMAGLARRYTRLRNSGAQQ